MSAVLRNLRVTVPEAVYQALSADAAESERTVELIARAALEQWAAGKATAGAEPAEVRPAPEYPDRRFTDGLKGPLPCPPELVELVKDLRYHVPLIHATSEALVLACKGADISEACDIGETLKGHVAGELFDLKERILEWHVRPEDAGRWSLFREPPEDGTEHA